MKKQLLLATLLGVATTLSLASGAFADTMTSSSCCNNNCMQDVKASLGACKMCEVLPCQPVCTTIDCCRDGALTSPLAPGFKVCSNSPCGTVTVKATVDAGTTGLNALSQVGSAYYIALANTCTKPCDAAVYDALNIGTPCVANNANVIAYPITTPCVTNLEGNLGLNFAWSAADKGFKATNSGAGKSNVITTIGPCARTNTFGCNDSTGNYVAHVMLSFI